jgi:hypothetical protein
MLGKELVNYQDKLYWVYRRVKHSQVKEGSIGDLKDFWMCNVVVRNRNQQDDSLLFLREIEEAKIIKEMI